MKNRDVFPMLFACLTLFMGLHSANGQTQQTASIQPPLLLFVEACAKATCPPKAMVFYAKASGIDAADAAKNARKAACDKAASYCAASPSCPICVSDITCPNSMRCGTENAIMETNGEYCTNPLWEVTFECCCADGTKLVTAGQGQTFCEAYRIGLQNAHDFATAYHGGACRCTYRITHRPCWRVCR